MKAYEVEEVKFTMTSKDSPVDIGLVWKEGVLYLAMSGVVLSDGSVLYEIPLEKITDISITEGEPTRLRINIPALDIEVSGAHAERLMALRHFLLPQIKARGPNDDLACIIKLWGVGMHSPLLISSLTKIDERKVYKLLEEAEKKGYIDDKRVTEKGMDLLSEEDRETVRKISGGRV